MPYALESVGDWMPGPYLIEPHTTPSVARPGPYAKSYSSASSRIVKGLPGLAGLVPCPMIVRPVGSFDGMFV